MAIVRVQVRIPRDTGLPEDVTINTWHFTTQANADPDRTTQAGSIGTALTNFYQAIDQYLAVHIAPPAEMRFYDLAEAEPRVPFYSPAMALTPGTVAGLPGEVAVAMSFQGDPVSGVSQARKRGRVFLGPLETATSEGVTGGRRPLSTFRTDVATAAAALITASEAAAEWSWIVFSGTAAGPKLPDGTYTDAAAGITVVTNGWIDNAFDTIRARGLASTARTTFT